MKVGWLKTGTGLDSFAWKWYKRYRINKLVTVDLLSVPVNEVPIMA